MSEQLVTIEKFLTPEIAHICQARLETEGIKTYLFDENSQVLYGGPATGGVKLQVHKENAQKAHQIIEEIEAQHANHADNDDDLIDDPDN